MSDRELRDALTTVHRELSDPDALAAADREMLETVAADLERVLDGEQDEHPEGLRERVEHTALAYEAEHPRLSAVLGQIVDALQRMGI